VEGKIVPAVGLEVLAGVAVRSTCRMCINGVDVCFGAGCFDKMLPEVSLLGGRWLVVTTAGGSMIRHGWVPRIVEEASRQGATVNIYRWVWTNPTTDSADKVYRVARRLRVTVVIGVGGGSAIDVAKAVAAALASDATPSELYRKLRPVKGSVPLVAIPSTHGTGTEVDRFAVLSDKVTSSKAAIVDERIKPRMAIVDPRLTLTLPQPLAGATVIDAFCHALESYVAVNASQLSRGFAREALIAIGEGVRKLKTEGWGSLSVRSLFHYASMMAGVAIDLSRTTLLHALEHPMSFRHPSIHHGIGLAVLLPFWVELVDKEAGEELAEALRYAGLEDPASVHDLIKELLGGMPRLSELRVSPEEARIYVKDAFRYLKPLVENTPGYPFDRDELAARLEEYFRRVYG